jgi:hypothetical protein
MVMFDVVIYIFQEESGSNTSNRPGSRFSSLGIGSADLAILRHASVCLGDNQSNAHCQ